MARLMQKLWSELLVDVDNDSHNHMPLAVDLAMGRRHNNWKILDTITPH